MLRHIATMHIATHMRYCDTWNNLNWIKMHVPSFIVILVERHVKTQNIQNIHVTNYKIYILDTMQ